MMIIFSRLTEFAKRSGTDLLPVSIGQCFFERLIMRLQSNRLCWTMRQPFLDSTIGSDPKFTISHLMGGPT